MQPLNATFAKSFNDEKNCFSYNEKSEKKNTIWYNINNFNYYMHMHNI